MCLLSAHASLWHLGCHNKNKPFDVIMMRMGERERESWWCGGGFSYHVGQIDEGIVDGNNLNLLVGESCTEHETTDASETKFMVR